jgi:hypothetical protein
MDTGRLAAWAEAKFMQQTTQMLRRAQDFDRAVSMKACNIGVPGDLL